MHATFTAFFPAAPSSVPVARVTRFLSRFGWGGLGGSANGRENRSSLILQESASRRLSPLVCHSKPFPLVSSEDPPTPPTMIAVMTPDIGFVGIGTHLPSMAELERAVARALSGRVVHCRPAGGECQRRVRWPPDAGMTTADTY